jgi:cytochrome c biogenesis protein CcmG/thiol:disulfide interchange protein DsbE
MKHPLRWTAVSVGLVVALLGIVLSMQMGTSPQYSGGPIIDREAPAFDLPILDGDGTRIDLDALAGKSVIVNFWNSWCIPCQEETPALSAFWDRHADDPDVAMVGIVRDDTTGAARAYVREHGLGWTIALDPKGQAALAYGTTGQPETYAISASGVVTGKQLSRVSVDDLEALLGSAQAG